MTKVWILWEWVHCCFARIEFDLVCTVGDPIFNIYCFGLMRSSSLVELKSWS